MVIAQGEVWWADLAEPQGSEPGFRRPVVVVAVDEAGTHVRVWNRRKQGYDTRGDATGKWDVPATSYVVVIDKTGTLSPRATGLDRESVANVSQVVTLNKASLGERTGKLTSKKLGLILDGIDVVLGR